MAVTRRRRRHTEPGLQANWHIEAPPSEKDGGVAIWGRSSQSAALQKHTFSKNGERAFTRPDSIDDHENPMISHVIPETSRSTR
jgi:hypothetical protein